MPAYEAVTMELFRQNLKRIAWRLQYRTRTQHLRECPMQVDYYASTCIFTTQTDSDLYVAELLNGVPSKAKYILKRLIIDGLTEQEVASELKIS